MAEDIPFVEQLDAELSALHRSAWPEIFAEGEPAMSATSTWLADIESENSGLFVAEVEDERAGFVSVRLISEHRPSLRPVKYAVVPSLVVASAHRGQGVGSLLMAQVEQWAVQRGAVDVRLTVWAFNEAAMHLYKELGYRVRTSFLSKSLSGET